MPEQTGNIEFQLLEINLIEGSFSFPNQQMAEGTPFQFEIQIEHRLNLKENSILVLTNINTRTEAINTSLGNLKSGITFKLNDINVLLNADNKLNPDSEILQAINSIAISTTRGMMFMHFKGTFLHKAVLPVIDISTLSVNI